jgi:hypothetical protein
MFGLGFSSLQEIDAIKADIPRRKNMLFISHLFN